MKRLTPLILLAALVASVLFVPFRHRTLVTEAGGGFAFRQEIVWAPLWRQPATAAGVAEYPFGWLLGVWGALVVLALFHLALRLRARRRKETTS